MTGLTVAKTGITGQSPTSWVTRQSLVTRIQPLINLLSCLAPVAGYCVIEQLVGQILGDRRGLEIRHSRVGIGAVKGGVIGKVKEDGLHLPPHHSLNSVAGLSKRRIYTGKFKPADIESIADKVQGPAVRRRIGVAEVIDLLMIGGVFYYADRGLGQGIHRNDVHCPICVRRNINLQVEAVGAISIPHEPVKQMNGLEEDVPATE